MTSGSLLTLLFSAVYGSSLVLAIHGFFPLYSHISVVHSSPLSTLPLSQFREPLALTSSYTHLLIVVALLFPFSYCRSIILLVASSSSITFMDSCFLHYSLLFSLLVFLSPSTRSRISPSSRCCCPLISRLPSHFFVRFFNNPCLHLSHLLPSLSSPSNVSSFLTCHPPLSLQEYEATRGYRTTEPDPNMRQRGTLARL